MNTFGLIVIIAAIIAVVFYLPKLGNKREAEKKKQKDIKREANEKIMLPQKKLHEEEKKRWEDKYWESH